MNSSDTARKPKSDYQRLMDYELDVCDHCLRAVCWWGIFGCENYQSAGITKRKVRDLIKLGREHKSYLTTAMIERHTGVRP
jgi:hypothetical protein